MLDVVGALFRVSVRNPIRETLLAPGLIALILAAPLALAQTGGIEPQVEDGKRIYMASQFARFAPQTAADVVRQIPGFSVTDVSNDRGLGEASQNVLINGQRITGKGNDAITVLRRIPVSAVQRFEVLDGAMLDISGLSGHVLNVITEQVGLQGNFAWRPQFRQRVGHYLPQGEVNLSGNSALGDFTAGLKLNGFRGGGWGGETEYRPGADVSFLRAKQSRFAFDSPRFSGSLSRRGGAGSILNLNASISRSHDRSRGATSYQEPGGPLTTEDSLSNNRKWTTEVGSDYEFDAGAGRLKLIGFFSHRNGPSESTLITLEDGQTVPTGLRFTRDSTQGERVGRAEYRWKALDSDWTLSGEAAYNYVDAAGSLEVLDDMGQFQPLALPGASSRVAERRGESILSFSRPVGSGWSLQVSGGGEYSQLRQDGAGGKTRNFWRPKGSVSAAWNPPSPWEMNLKLQRKVGQLNFFDFLASVDVNNNNANGGNPELVPPRSWLLQFELIRSLGAAGKVRLSVEGEDIQDLVEQVPLSPTTEAPGNISSAKRVRATFDASLLLDAVGIRGGRLDSTMQLTGSRVRDPLTGMHRRLNGRCCYWNVDFRHDVPGTQWTWGLSGEKASRSHSYRLDYESTSWDTRPSGSLYVEHKNVLGLKVRAEIGNLLRSRDRSYSVSYADRRDGPVDYTRDSRLSSGWTYRLKVSGTF
jgi:hypothetical protein